MNNIKPATAIDVIVCIGVTVFLLGMSVVLYGSDSSAGANQIALVCGAALATGIGIKNGHSWQVIEETIVGGISTAMPAVIILFSVGSLIGAWMLCGTVPTMIYYGMLLLDPAFFYAAACLLCAITALSIGSSWTVAGTLGVGLIAIAAGMGLSVRDHGRGDHRRRLFRRQDVAAFRHHQPGTRRHRHRHLHPISAT